MRPVYLQILIFLFLSIFGFKAGAQTCSGSLGDPVINETFGAGSAFGPGPALPANATTFKYTADGCPPDGSYTINTGVAGCFSGTWQVVPQDHTGDPNGYMMVVNSSYEPGVFYTQHASGDKLCPNTTYEFAAWILNIIRDDSRTANYIKPNITFSIETADGRVLKTYNTGDIPQASLSEFKQYGTLFTTPSDGSEIVVKMNNNAPGGAGNDLALDDITFRPCGPVIQSGFGTIDATADVNICYGADAVYTLKATQTGYSDPYYQWQVNKNDGNGWADIAGQTSTSLNINLVKPAVGKYQYRVGILDGPGVSLTCRIYSQPLTINVNALPAIDIKDNTIVCEGQPLQLTAFGGSAYHWTGPNGFTSDEQSPMLTANANNSFNGTYSVTVTNDKGCGSASSTNVSVLPKVSPSISGNTTICTGGSAQLQAGGGSYYKWTPATGLDHDDIPNPVASPLENTTYHVKIDNGGCSDETQQVTVTVLKPATANAGKDVTIQEGESIQLKGTIGGDDIRYYWTPSETMNDPLSASPIVNPTDNTTYTLHVESLFGCGDATDDVFVRVYKRITIPNTFTPNNDGVNDTWLIDKLYTYPECDVSVYTRNGQQVFKSRGYGTPWNGGYQGYLLPPGVYYYVIDLKNNTPLRSGWVMLVR